MPDTKILKHPVAAEQCASCIFRTDGNQVELRAGRLDKIREYLLRGKPHRCHGPATKGHQSKLACRGGRDYQLQLWSRMGWIEDATDEALEKRMRELESQE